MAWVVPPTFTVGQVLTAAQQNILGGDLTFLNGLRTDERAYSQATAGVACSGTTEGTATTLVGPTTGFTPDGTEKVLIEFWAPYYTTNQTAQNGVISIFEDGTSIGWAQVPLINTTLAFGPIYVPIRRTPSNASHTYTAKGWTTSGTMTVTAGGGGAGNPLPMYLRVTRVGA